MLQIEKMACAEVPKKGGTSNDTRGTRAECPLCRAQQAMVNLCFF